MFYGNDSVSNGTPLPYPGGGISAAVRNEYNFIHPAYNYSGRPFSEWAAEYTNWLVNPQIDGYFSGDVIFLRGYDSENRQKEMTPSSSTERDVQPLVKVGEEGIQVPAGNAVFFPSVLALVESVDSGIPNEGSARRSAARRLMKGCSMNNSQIFLNGKAIPKMPSYVESIEFMLNVPDYSSGNYAACRNFQLTTPGKRPCVAIGNFHMVQFNSPAKYILHISSNGASEARGICYSNALFELKIYSQGDGETSKNSRTLLDGILSKKVQEGKLSKVDSVRVSQNLNREAVGRKASDKRTRR
jgi:hypothetical protein